MTQVWYEIAVALNLPSAIKYNESKAGKLWRFDQLPEPLYPSDDGPGTATFSRTVAALQRGLSLGVDGKLGPDTLRAIKSSLSHVDIDDRDFPGEEDDGDVAIGDDELDARDNGVSDVLIIGRRDVPLSEDAIKAGVSACNWRDDDVHPFRSRTRRTKMEHFVLHESVTRSVDMCVKALLGKARRTGYRYGVHFCIAADGRIHQHNDPVTDRLVHGNQLNGTSAGVEVITPYNPGKLQAGDPWSKTIPGPWWCWKPAGRKKEYVLPTDAQLVATLELVRVLVENCDDLPRAFPTKHLNNSQRRIEGWKARAKPGPGIVAHRDYAGHADGRYLLDYVMKEWGEG